MKRQTAALAVTMCVANSLFAAFVEGPDVLKAATRFIASDPIGSSVLKERKVGVILKRDRLWIVSLEPSGYIVFSGSDLADPIVSFSQKVFTEPDEQSPAYAYLARVNDGISRLEEASKNMARHERWVQLLQSSQKLLLSATPDTPSKEAVVVEPFLETHYNQWVPYNDFCPVRLSETDMNVYRGRSPCGCVATAAAQMFKYFEWPSRIDTSTTFEHGFQGTNLVETIYPIRFNGYVPMQWSGISNSYDTWSVDARGEVAESIRYPIARLLLWMDSMAHMHFAAESGANYGEIAKNASDWYTRGHWVNVTNKQVLADLKEGVPLQTMVQGHAIVAHGWASDGDNSYIYLNFGWGGSSDGYYNIDSSTLDKPLVENGIFVGHYPRAKPIVTPLPKVCDTAVSLQWDFPNFYTNKLERFIVKASKLSYDAVDVIDNFSNSVGESSDTNISIAANDEFGYDGQLLYIHPYSHGTYTFQDEYVLTSASVLTFKLRSHCAYGANFQIQARFDDGEWQMILKPKILENSTSNWTTERVYLGEHGGQKVQFRIYNNHEAGSYFSSGRLLVDDWKVTKVLKKEEVLVENVSASSRSMAVQNLAIGGEYSFTVAAILGDAIVDGEESDPVSISIAGEAFVPLAGVESFVETNLEFSASGAGDSWSYSCDEEINDSIIAGEWRCSTTVFLPYGVAKGSILSFDWSANNWYGNESAYDILNVVFEDESGAEETLWYITNRVEVARTTIEISLEDIAGRKGRVTISYSHNGGAWKRGVLIYSPKVTKVLTPVVPEVKWESTKRIALGYPQILSVTSNGRELQEGFYRDIYGKVQFAVQCSDPVISLEAYPSHLAVLDDSKVSVSNGSNGLFIVSIDASEINEENIRTRMILSLVATDANGTIDCKDISIRLQSADDFNPVKLDYSTIFGNHVLKSIQKGWLKGATSFNNALQSNALRLGPNEDAALVLQTTADHIPWRDMDARTNAFSLALYADVSAMPPSSKAVMVAIGNRSSNSVILFREGDCVRLAFVNSNGGIIGTAASVTAKSGYHLYVAVVDPCNGQVYLNLDDNYSAYSSAGGSISLGNGFQIGSVFYGCPSGFVKGTNMALVKLLGYDTFLSVDDVQSLVLTYPSIENVKTTVASDVMPSVTSLAVFTGQILNLKVSASEEKNGCTFSQISVADGGAVAFIAADGSKIPSGRVTIANGSYILSSCSMPALPDDATTGDISSILENATDADSLNKNLVTVEEYNAYRAWILEKSSEQEAGDSVNAWLGFALDSPNLLTRDDALTDEDVLVEGFGPAENSGEYSLEIAIENFAIGDNAAVERIVKVFGLDGSPELDLTKFSSNNVTFEASKPQNGKVRLMARPKENSDTFFMRVMLNK